MNMQTLRYSMVIEWSEADQAYVVILPEWAGRVVMPVTHGDTYEQAVKRGREVLEMLVDAALRDGESLPSPKVYAV